MIPALKNSTPAEAGAGAGAGAESRGSGYVRGGQRSLNEIFNVSGTNHQMADDWDHEIFSAYTPKWCHESSGKWPNTHNSIDWTKMPEEFNLGSSVSLYCKERVGLGKNEDIQMPLVAPVA